MYAYFLFSSPRNSPMENRSQGHQPEVHKFHATDAGRDAASDSTAAIHSETVIVCGNDSEMKTVQSSYSSEYFNVPPPPAVLNNFTSPDAIVSSEKTDKTITLTQKSHLTK